MILADYEIRERCEKGMIKPFAPELVKKQAKGSSPLEPIISYGVSSYGYDIRVDREFKIFHNAHTPIVDPKRLDEKNFVEISQDEPVTIPPNSFALCRSFEEVDVPRDLMVICLGKSTYARCGIVVNVTPLEPEWKGHITLEISNTTPNPALIYPMEGICQLIFLRHPTGCKTSYKDRAGKYQGQRGITLPRV